MALDAAYRAAYLSLRTTGGDRGGDDGEWQRLERDSALYPHPKAVLHSPYTPDNTFFDQADLVQVRYEMVRRHEVDGQVISAVTTNFGVSPTKLLQGANGAGDGWAGRFAARSARPQSRTQAFHRDPDFRCRSAEQKPRDQHVAAARRDRGSVRGQNPPAQSGACSGAQKKNDTGWTVHARYRPTLAIYETLRAAVLSGHSNGQCGLAILIHRGLAAWLGDLTRQAPPPGPRRRAHSDPASTGVERTNSRSRWYNRYFDNRRGCGTWLILRSPPSTCAATLISMSDSRPCARSRRTSRAPNVNMLCVTGPSAPAGRPSGSM